MNLIESVKFNKGKTKIYAGVPGNLVAFACKIAFSKGYEGYLAFDAKTVLVKHYQETLYATHFRGTKMMIETPAASRLIKQYFKSLLSGKSVKWLKNWYNILIMNTFFGFSKVSPPYFWE